MADEERIRHNFVMDMSEFLLGYGFVMDEALKTSKDFYDKHKGKIKDSLAIF
jgi:hypothetical protein